MKRRGTVSIGAALLLGIFLTRSEVSASNGPVFELRGIPAGNYVDLTFKPKRDMKAVRIYSEPSRTFLLMIVDPDFKKTREGKAWLKANASGRKAPRESVTKDLPKEETNVQVAAPPASDDRVSIHIVGTWEGGKKEDRQFDSGKCDPAGYVITVDMMGSPPGKH